MRSRMPTIHCDHEYGCDEWEVDDYAATVHSVNGIRITETHRSLGWKSDRMYDYCPQHKGGGNNENT